MRGNKNPHTPFIPPPKREYDPCPLSGQVIDNIYLAISDPESGKPARFDKVLEHLRKREEIQKGQQLVYIGAGNFGIVENTSKKGKRRIELIKKIPYEDSYQKKQWRRELSPGVSRDYVPSPEPLDSLYTLEELKSFPKLGVSAIINSN